MVWTWQPAAASDRFPKRRKAEEKKQREERIVVVKAIIKKPRSGDRRRRRREEGEDEEGASAPACSSSIMRVRRYQGTMMLLTTAGAFCAFSLMTIAVGTDYWLYSRGMCRPKHHLENETIRKNEEVLTHSGLWRTCCTEGTYRGVCKDIEHFPEDADYEQDTGEYLLRVVRASSLFPICSVCLLFLGGLCVAASEFYKRRHNIILTAGILFISAGLSNIIGIIVYISAMSGDNQQDNKKTHEYGWSFNFGALSFVLAEMAGVLAVHVFIEKHRQLRTNGRSSIRKPPPVLRSSSFYRNRYYNYNRSRRCSYRSNHSGGGGGGSFHHHASLQPRDSSDQNHLGVTCVTPPLSGRSVTPPLQRGLSVTPDFMLYAMTTPLQAPAPPRDNGKAGGGIVAAAGNNVNNTVAAAATPNDVNNSLTGNCAASRRTTPV